MKGHRIDHINLFSIREDDLSSDATRGLLGYHFEQMHEKSPNGLAFALDLSSLLSNDMVVWSAWVDDEIAAVGALRELGRAVGEVKSMRTHPNWLRRGAASAVLDHIIWKASQRGLKKLSLETGSGPEFDAAVALYGSRGFIPGDCFGDYKPNGFNQFFHLYLY
jgi:putative acetyltransferase